MKRRLTAAQFAVLAKCRHGLRPFANEYVSARILRRRKFVRYNETSGVYWITAEGARELDRLQAAIDLANDACGVGAEDGPP